MAKRNKNLQHKDATKRKAQASAEVAKIGLSLSDEIVVIGFVFRHLSASHLAYIGLTSINKLCKTYAGIDICVFTQHIIAPCVTPLCAVFSVSELTRWKENALISTDIGTTIDALASNASIIYHYAFDPEFINKPHIDSLSMKLAFCDPRVRIVVRDESHKLLIEEEFCVKVCDTIIPDCNAEMLAKLVIKEMKDGRDS